MIQKRIGILRGGAGNKYTDSLNRGGDIILHIFENLKDRYKPVDILVDKDYIWHQNGLPINPSDLMHQVDIVWNVSHHSFSNILESLGIPNIGSGSFLGSFLHNRDALKEHMKNIGVGMPRHIVLPFYQKDFDGEKSKYAVKEAKKIFEKFSSPWIVRSYTEDQTMGPVRGREGSQRPSASNGMGIHLAKTFPELIDAIEDLSAQAGGVNHKKSILVEEFIGGKVASLHSLPDFRGENIYTLPFGKYASGFSNQEKLKLVSTAKEIYSHLNAKHYLKIDFILTSRGKVYLLGVESVPDLRENSHFHEVCESADLKMHNIVEHILEDSLRHN